MKKIVFSAAALSLGCSLLLAGPALGGEDKSSISKTCKDNNGFGLSHGACVSVLTSRQTGAHDADICKSPSQQASVGAESVGECIKALKKVK